MPHAGGRFDASDLKLGSPASAGFFIACSVSESGRRLAPGPANSASPYEKVTAQIRCISSEMRPFTDSAEGRPHLSMLSVSFGENYRLISRIERRFTIQYRHTTARNSADVTVAPELAQQRQAGGQEITENSSTQKLLSHLHRHLHCLSCNP